VSLEAAISIGQIPDFRRERYGHVLLEGEIVESGYEVRSTEIMLTMTVAATNAGTQGADSPYPRTSASTTHPARSSMED
jgi:hypothetical protein